MTSFETFFKEKKIVRKPTQDVTILPPDNADDINGIDWDELEKKYKSYNEPQPYYNISWIVPKEIIRSARPGYPKEDIGPEVVDKWFDKIKEITGTIPKTIITFLTQEELDDFYTFDLLENYRQRGITVHHIPKEDTELPTLPSERPELPGEPEGMKFEKSVYESELIFSEEELKSINQIIENSPKPVLIHCSAGQDRTGAVSDYLKEVHGIKDPKPEYFGDYNKQEDELTTNKLSNYNRRMLNRWKKFDFGNQ